VVIGVIGDSSIIVSADSRMTHTVMKNNSDKIDTMLDETCKIYNYNNFHFAVMGQLLEENVSNATESCKTEKSLDDVAKKYSDRFAFFMRSYLSLISLRFTPTVFNTYIERNGPFFSQCLFFGYENDSAKMWIVRFLVKNDSNVSKRVSVSRQLFTNKWSFVAGGHVSGILDTLRSSTIWNDGIIPTMKFLIEREKQFTVQVGGPIDVIEVRKNKVIEFPGKPGCPFTKNQ
jgi:hypothetical protein